MLAAPHFTTNTSNPHHRNHTLNLTNSLKLSVYRLIYYSSKQKIMSCNLLYLTIFLSLHAFNARRLGGHFCKETKKQDVSKIMNEAELQKSTNLLGTSITSPTILEEVVTHKEQEKADNSGYESSRGARTTNIKQDKIETIFRARNEIGEISGLVPVDNKAMTSPYKDLRQPTGLQELKKRKKRSVLEKVGDDTEEAVKSEENEGPVEDVVFMDYAQPQRKPPIHNERN